jgi:hypothetical protein
MEDGMWKALWIAGMLGVAACGSSTADDKTEEANASADDLSGVRVCGAHERVVNCGPWTAWHEIGNCCTFVDSAPCPWTQKDAWNPHANPLVPRYGGNTETQIERSRGCTAVGAPAGQHACRQTEQQTNVNVCSIACRDWASLPYPICSDSD